MALAGEIEAVLDLKASADAHFGKWRKEAHHFPNAVNHHIQGVEVHEGDWENHGSIKEWTYTCEGKVEKFKERLEVLDDEKRIVKLVGLGGNVMEELKVYNGIFQFVPKPEGGCTGKIILEYEKRNEQMRAPTRYLEFLKNLVKDMDEHLVKEK